MSTQQAPLVVAVALVDDLQAPTRILAARRTGPGKLAGLWEFPGGKLEPGESARDAIHREIMEELEVQIDLGDLIGAQDPELTDWPLSAGMQMRIWWARARDEITASTAHDELRWLTRDNLETVPWIPADLDIVRRIALSMR